MPVLLVLNDLLHAVSLAAPAMLKLGLHSQQIQTVIATADEADEHYIAWCSTLTECLCRSLAKWMAWKLPQV